MQTVCRALLKSVQSLGNKGSVYHAVENLVRSQGSQWIEIQVSEDSIEGQEKLAEHPLDHCILFETKPEGRGQVVLK